MFQRPHWQRQTWVQLWCASWTRSRWRTAGCRPIAVQAAYDIHHRKVRFQVAPTAPQPRSEIEIESSTSWLRHFLLCIVPLSVSLRIAQYSHNGWRGHNSSLERFFQRFHANYRTTRLYASKHRVQGGEIKLKKRTNYKSSRKST